jgi:hypothetical protein
MNQKEAAQAPRILKLDIPVNNTLYEVEELIKDIEKTSFKLLSDITLTNTIIKKQQKKAEQKRQNEEVKALNKLFKEKQKTKKQEQILTKKQEQILTNNEKNYIIIDIDDDHIIKLKDLKNEDNIKELKNILKNNNYLDLYNKYNNSIDILYHPTNNIINKLINNIEDKKNYTIEDITDNNNIINTYKKYKNYVITILNKYQNELYLIFVDNHQSLIRETSLIIPKKPTEFLDLPVEIRNIIKDFTFNDYDNGKDLKKTFNKQFTNIDNVILLKKMFGEYPKELILNDNDYNYNLNKYNTKWNKMRIPENIKNNFIDILNKYNLIKFNPKYNKILLNLYVCLYNDLNFDIILSVYETYTPYIKLEPDEIIGGCGFLGLGKYITIEGQSKIAAAAQSNIFHIDKLGCVYNYEDFDDDNDSILNISDLIGGIKYKDMHELITYIKNKLYNS